VLGIIFSLVALAQIRNDPRSRQDRPLAIAIISGMAFQLPLVFLVMPVLFVVLRVRREKPQASRVAL